MNSFFFFSMDQEKSVLFIWKRLRRDETNTPCVIGRVSKQWAPSTRVICFHAINLLLCYWFRLFGEFGIFLFGSGATLIHTHVYALLCVCVKCEWMWMRRKKNGIHVYINTQTHSYIRWVWVRVIEQERQGEGEHNTENNNNNMNRNNTGK